MAAVDPNLLAVGLTCLPSAIGPYARIVDGAPRRGYSDRGHWDGGVFKNRSTVEKAGRFTNICELRTRSVVGTPEAHNIALQFPAKFVCNGITSC